MAGRLMYGQNRVWINDNSVQWRTYKHNKGDLLMPAVILSRFTILRQIASMDVWSFLSVSFILSMLFLAILFYVYKRIVYIMYPVLCQRWQE